jgi:Cu2+-exporting ATPase
MEIGVLPLRMQALDGLSSCEVFAFDKTGTLTAGFPVLSSVHVTDDMKRDQCLRYASAMSADSEHPVAKAIRMSSSATDVAVTDLVNVPGAGVSATIQDREWRLGKPDFAIKPNKLAKETQAIIDDYRSQGQIVSVLASQDSVAAVFGFDDPMRTGVVDMLEGLKHWGVNRFAVLSGDAQASVTKLCNQLGIRQCLGGQKPVDKLTWTRNQQQKGRRVVMFGDGINDAPTLASADVSISFAGATDLANVSSDFLILGDSADVLADARRLSQLTQRNIMQNFMWAAGYNLLAVPFAAAGYIPPWGAAIGMSLSSLIVVANALRLRTAVIR